MAKGRNQATTTRSLTRRELFSLASRAGGRGQNQPRRALGMGGTFASLCLLSRQTTNRVLRIEGKMLHPTPSTKLWVKARPARDQGVIP